MLHVFSQFSSLGFFKMIEKEREKRSKKIKPVIKIKSSSANQSARQVLHQAKKIVQKNLTKILQKRAKNICLLLK